MYIYLIDFIWCKYFLGIKDDVDEIFQVIFFLFRRIFVK